MTTFHMTSGKTFTVDAVGIEGIHNIIQATMEVEGDGPRFLTMPGITIAIDKIEAMED